MTDVTRIPRSIYQTFPRDKLTPALRENMARLQAQNPGWAYQGFDHEERESFIAQEYGSRVVALYRRIAPSYGAARADLFRYLLLYRRGGVYLDVKSRFDLPIDQVIQDDDSFVLSQWRSGPGHAHAGWGLHDALSGVPGGEYQQWHIIAAPGHPFLAAVIDRVLGNIERYSVRRNDVGWPGVLSVTGPIAYTLAIAPLVDCHPCRIVPDETALSLEYNVLGGSSHQQLFGRHYTQNTDPVVRQPGWRGIRDRLHVEARRHRQQWRARRQAISASRASG